MRELASLGTSIPGPALAACMTAVLCVKLGNFYGVSWEAQPPADQLIRGLSKDRWEYYLNERLEQDRIILVKLGDDRPVSNWISLVKGLQIDPKKMTSKDTIALITATNAADRNKVKTISQIMFRASVG